MSTLHSVHLPDFGRAAHRPVMAPASYAARLRAAAARMVQAGFNQLVIYADREHCATLAYLTGFDPRFEEALLLLDADGRSLLLVGNECAGFLPDEAVGVAWEIFQDFSLPGQPRDASRPLATILRSFGIGADARVGCVGWKTLDAGLSGVGRGDGSGDGSEDGSGDGSGHGSGQADAAIEIPAFIVDTLRELTGSRDRVRNANALFNGLPGAVAPDNPLQHGAARATGPQAAGPRLIQAPGLRLINEAQQIAVFEHVATVASDGVLALLRAMRPGLAEWQLERHLDAQGLPLSCHRMLSFGAKARRGLSSPGDAQAVLGDPYTTALGVFGALTCRAGRVAASALDVPAADRGFVDALSRNYFDVVAAWYGALRVGTTGGAVFAAADAARDASLMRFALNPGHCLHLDEWVHSPFAAGSTVPLLSGFALQMDIIPVVPASAPFSCINAEDGVVLADDDLRAQLARDLPDLWQRTQRRRAFMRETLGIELDASVLPLSNLTGWLPPYALDLGRALVMH